MFLVSCVDFEFYKFSGKRSTIDSIQIMSFGEDFGNTLPKLISDFWYLLLLSIVLIFLLNYLYGKIKIEKKNVSSRNLFFRRNFFIQFTLHILIFGLLFIGFRGGIQLKPLNILSASQYGSAKQSALILNTPFTLIKSYGKNELAEIHFMPHSEADKIYPLIHSGSNQTINKKNICLIIFESLGKEYIGSLNGKQNDSYTPFLDSLIQHSFVFENAYANAKKSIEGIPAIVASLPALMDDPYITSPYNSNQFTSIAGLLNDVGYNTMFFHGGTNGTMGFDNFSGMAGFKKYFGRKEYGNENDFDGSWGIFDESFLQYTCKKISEGSKPFFSTVFTLSSHHPYHIPEKLQGKFKKGNLNILESIGYADYSLKKFFESASKEDWYANTVFVITGDHTSESDAAFYKERVGMYSVPVIFFDPSRNQKVLSDKSVQQIDILPTLMNYIHYPEKYFSFGNDMFDSSKANNECISFINGSYQLIEGKYALHFIQNKASALFEFTSDSLLQNNLLDKLPEKTNELSLKTKAIIQQFNHALIHNKMTVEHVKK